MNNVKKAMKKGFTLVELVVVMAIFSILLVGVMSLVTPVSKIFKNTALSEKTYSYTNNIQLYVQSKLEYADNLWVYTSDILGSGSAVTDSDIASKAEEFRQTYYDHLATAESDSAVHPTEGNVYVMRLINNPSAYSGTPGSTQRGQIVLYTFDFKSNQVIPTSSSGNPTEQLNNVYFNASDSAYTFSYALGASTLMTDPGANAPSGEPYRCLASDYDNTQYSLTYANLSLSIVMAKADGSEVVRNCPGGTGTYTAFETPAALSVANIPLTNISFRMRNEGTVHAKKRYVSDFASVDPKYAKQYSTAAFNDIGLSTTIPDMFIGSATEANQYVDFDNDIYFVFALADEFH